MRRLLVGLVVLAALVVAADRGGLWLAERHAADRAREQGLHGATVDVRGVPFLTQLASSELGEVVVTGDAYRADLRDAGVEGGGLGSIDLTGVRVLARGVSIDSRIDSRRDFAAAQVTVDGVVPYAAVSAAAGSGTQVTPAADGQVRLQRSVPMFGRSVQVRALARVTAVEGVIVVRPTEPSVEGAGRFGELAANAVLTLMTLRYPVPGLPENLVLTEIVPTADGLAVVLTGRAVSLTNLR